MTVEEHKVIRTEKTESGVIQYYNGIGMDVLFIRTFELGKEQFAELI